MNTKRLTTISILTAFALIIFVIEAHIPPPVPISGIKLGLANIITLVALDLMGSKEAFIVLMLRIILSSIFVGTMMSFMYSFAGGLLCFGVMSLTIKFFKKNEIWIISVLGAISHNVGQIIMAIIFMRTWAVAAYLPILIISAVITGIFTGFSAQAVIKRKGDLIERK